MIKHELNLLSIQNNTEEKMLPFNNDMLPGMSLLGIIFIFFSIILGLLWTILPFAVFGIKSRLDKIINLLEEINRKLK